MGTEKKLTTTHVLCEPQFMTPLPTYKDFSSVYHGLLVLPVEKLQRMAEAKSKSRSYLASKLLIDLYGESAKTWLSVQKT